MLRREGYDVVTRLGPDETGWMAVASADIEEGDLGSAEDRMVDAANSFSGEFDGYERTT